MILHTALVFFVFTVAAGISKSNEFWTIDQEEFKQTFNNEEQYAAPNDEVEIQTRLLAELLHGVGSLLDAVVGAIGGLISDLVGGLIIGLGGGEQNTIPTDGPTAITGDENGQGEVTEPSVPNTIDTGYKQLMYLAPN